MGRLRFNKNAAGFLKDQPEYYVDLENKPPFYLNDLFLKIQPLEIEIGMGKGNFILEHALKNPDINFIGIEKYQTVLFKAVKKFLNVDKPLENLKVTSLDANQIDLYFKKHSIKKIYLNFSDPWPKKAHEKRRLVHENFLVKYQQILEPNGLIVFKTDNDALFSWFINEVVVRNHTWINVIFQTTDLYKEVGSEWLTNNIQTEYEKKFLLENKNINLVAFNFSEKES